LSKPVHHLYLSAAVERCLASDAHAMKHAASVIAFSAPGREN